MNSRYDTDPEALAWARAKVQHQLDRLAKFEEQATAAGKTDQARGISLARRSTAQMLLGGEGCVIGAFDERRPQMFDTPSGEEPFTPTELTAGRADVAALNAEFPDEPQDPTGPAGPLADMLPEWLCQRFGGLTPALRARSFWVDEAAAVRHAVARGGFETPAGGEQA